MRDRKALVIIGSPKQGNSYSLGEYFSGLLACRGVKTELIQANRMSHEDLLSKLDGAGIIVFSFPLYIDSLPGPLVATLEKLAKEPDAWQSHTKTILAIVNCGFPESAQARIALGIMEQFTDQVGARWAGGLAMGAGESMARRPVEDVGGMLRNVTSGLQIAADCLAAGEPVKSEAVELVGKRLFPDLMYRILGGRGFRAMAKANGVDIFAKPYAWKSR